MSEVACTVTARAGGTLLKKQSSSLSLVVDETCQWSIVLDNRDRDYNQSAAIANPRTYSEIFSLTYEDEAENSWTSPDLVYEDYEYDTNQVSMAGRCRLSQLDREDQVIVADAETGSSTFENTTVAAVLSAIAAAYGLTVTGAPERVVRLFAAVGNPLQMFRDLLNPTHCFRMGAGTQIVVQSITSNSAGPNFVDDEDLEILKFRRTSDLYNRATVERVGATVGQIQLVDQQRSAAPGENIYADQEVVLSELSRLFNITETFGERGSIQGIQFIDEEDEVIDWPTNSRTYVGLVPVAKLRFTYVLHVGHDGFGPYTPNWSMKVSGYPLYIEPVPTTGYSETRSAGAGDRPYPEPFTSLAMENSIDAGAAATALVDQGGRQGNSLKMATRLRPTAITWPNNSIGVTDFHSEIDASFVVDNVQISEDENGDTGTITMEATQSEAA